ncbi:MAG TPA: hypothetical protein VGV15_14930 [Terriglobales bacterium]|jgi:hypothetical protein|nr:hypothetical protein [Terriglobales bacterium]
MKVLATLLLSLSLPGSIRLLPPRSPLDYTVQRARKGGRWFLAQNGHAVYCYGPVRMIPEAAGGLQRVATYCQGERPIVPLKD